MKRGAKNQLARQIGEHLVVAELGRRDIIATPFAGNVPDFDLVAVAQSGRAVPIQVKAIRGGSWQFDARTFLQIEQDGDIQRVVALQRLSNPSLWCIFVSLRPSEDDRDRFFIFRWRHLQKICADSYGTVVRRPRNPQSTHYAIWPKGLSRFEERWAPFLRTLRK